LHLARPRLQRHARSCTHARAHAHTRTACMHSRAPTRTITHTHACTHARPYEHTYGRAHACTSTRMHEHSLHALTGARPPPSRAARSVCVCGCVCVCVIGAHAPVSLHSPSGMHSRQSNGACLFSTIASSLENFFSSHHVVSRRVAWHAFEYAFAWCIRMVYSRIYISCMLSCAGVSGMAMVDTRSLR
jgi:hypothetical protein